MKSSQIYLVVMAGGSGTRFWPKSTAKKPKQFLSFGKSTETLLQQTMSRFQELVPASSKNRMIVTTESLKGEVLKQFSEGSTTVLAEPSGRNTAPCVFWAAKKVFESDPDGIMLVMPSDHYIHRPQSFIESIRHALAHAASTNDLVTLGVKPTRAETGYGYLKTAGEISAGCFKVDAFVEKPNRVRAEAFLQSGEYLWNGGMFVWKARAILDAFNEYMPEMEKAWQDSGRDVEQAYSQMTATSIDFGVMEKAKNVVTFPLDCGWDDLGSWTSLETLAETLGAVSECGTVTAGDVIPVDSTGNVVDVQGHLVALLGVKDMIVVRQDQTILIADKHRAQDIRLVVEKIKKLFPDRA
jgi:mannose-1-phosphate guanylyltransferase